MVLSMDRWAGKVAVVTGASSGIGEAIVEQLVEHGVHVVGVARRSKLVEAKAKQLQGKKGKLYAFKADITKEKEVLKAFEWTTSKVGPVSILVNNAGLNESTPLSDGETWRWKGVLDLNVLALAVCTREALKVMKKHNITNGHIIHINSILGHKVLSQYSNFNVYPASKYAVTALTETLRQELVKNNSKVRVTHQPGVTESEMTTLNKDPNAKARTESFKTLPILKSEDIADGAIYVLSTPIMFRSTSSPSFQLEILPVNHKF